MRSDLTARGSAPRYRGTPSGGSEIPPRPGRGSSTTGREHGTGPLRPRAAIGLATRSDASVERLCVCIQTRHVLVYGPPPLSSYYRSAWQVTEEQPRLLHVPLPRDHVCDCRGERCKRHYGTRHSQQVRSAAATPGHGAGAKRSNGAAGMPHPGIQAAPPPVRSAAARATPVVQTRIRRELAHGAHCYSQLSVDPTATRARLRPLLRWGRAREKCTPRAAVLGKSVHHERAPPHGELLRSIVALFRCSEHATTTGLTGVSVSRHLRPGSAIVRPLEVCAR